MKPTPESEHVTIAQVRKTQGRRGEVAAEILTDFPERFERGQQMLLWDGTSHQRVVLENSWPHKGWIILKFRDVETITAAESLVGRQIQIPRSERRQLPPGAVYLSDLVGCVVREGGKLLGKVDAVEETGAAPLLKVPTAEGELLIPFAESICSTVDVEGQEIQVRLPEGLKNLNRK